MTIFKDKLYRIMVAVLFCLLLLAGSLHAQTATINVQSRNLISLNGKWKYWRLRLVEL